MYERKGATPLQSDILPLWEFHTCCGVLEAASLATKVGLTAGRKRLTRTLLSDKTLWANVIPAGRAWQNIGPTFSEIRGHIKFGMQGENPLQLKTVLE